MNETKRDKLWYNLLLMLLIAVSFYILLFSLLKVITAHGNEVKMPVLVNRNINDAIKLLEDQGFDVDIDSTYDMKKPSGTVLAQTPDTGQFVKEGRTVFLIINKMQAPPTPMPDLAGVSYRSAEIVLRSNKLNLGDTIHRPDIANGAILEALYNGRVVKTGDMIPQGSKITLVIGDGLGNTEFDVPDVVGLSYPEAVAIINASGLQLISVWDGRITDSQSAVIYAQTPAAINEFGGINTIKQGQIIDIKISQTAPVQAPIDPSQPGKPDNKRQAKPVQDNNQRPKNDDGDWN